MSKFVVEIDPSPQRFDCFVGVPAAFVDGALSQLFYGRVPSVVPLHVTVVGHSGATDRVEAYVGALAATPHQRKGVIVIGAAFAAALGIADGAQVTVRALPEVPVAATVVVEPATVDDSEIIEGNQRVIEHSMLRLLRVVHEGMRIPVSVSAGVRATLAVTEVRITAGRTAFRSSSGRAVAVLAEGTELYVATKMRKDALAAAAPGAPPKPREAVVRCVHASTQLSLASPPPGVVYVSAHVADANNWTEGMDVGALPMAVVVDQFAASSPSSSSTSAAAKSAQSDEPRSVTAPSMMRQAVRARVQVVADLPVAAVAGPEVLRSGHSRAANLFLFPQPAASVRPAEAAAPSSPSSLPSLEELAEVHGDALIKGLVGSIAAAIAAFASDGFVASPQNFLICGGKGCGKSAIAERCALASGLYTEVVECGGVRASALASMRTAVARCLANAPAALVLNDLDILVPADVDGRGSTLPGHLLADLETLLVETAWSSAVGDLVAASLGTAQQRGPPRCVVVATATGREQLNEAVRAAHVFAHVVKVAQLNTAARGVLLQQLVPPAIAPPSLLHRVAKSLDNYTPFDIRQLARRLLATAAAAASKDGGLGESEMMRVVEAFTPLAHSGVKFLKPPSQSWDDVGGMSEPRRVLHNAILLPAKFPSIFDKLPLKTRSGVLLFGPPGCGKTHLLSVMVAAEKLHCIVVNGPEVLDKYIGASEQKVREVFERAQAVAPCVIFFDEFDSIAPQRGHDNTGVTDRVVNQLLCYLDGVEGRKNVFVVAASSRPDLIDAALLRPGRLDKAVYCAMPTLEEREQVLRSHARKVRLDPAGVDFARVAAATERWSCADLAGLVSTANMAVMQRALDMHRHLAALNIGTPEQQQEAAASSVGAANENYFVISQSEAVRDSMERALRDSHTATVIAEAVKQQAVATSRSGGSLSPAKAAPPPAQFVTTDDLLHAMAKTRPSISAKDAVRYDALYRRFAEGRASDSKGSRSSEQGSSGFVPDSRMTMA